MAAGAVLAEPGSAGLSTGEPCAVVVPPPEGKVVFDAEGRPRHARKVRPDTDRRWQGHRVFAVDGTCLNLPRGLVHEGWRTPVDGAHYPQGLVSCLYRLQSRLPVDFDLHAHGNERAAALGHLNVLSANDVVVYDRGLLFL